MWNNARVVVLENQCDSFHREVPIYSSTKLKIKFPCNLLRQSGELFIFFLFGETRHYIVKVDLNPGVSGALSGRRNNF